MWIDILEKIRSKPLRVRRFILNATTGVMGVMVFFLWFALFSLQFEEEEGAVEVLYEETSPVDVLGNVVSGLWSNASDSIEQVKETYSGSEGTSSPVSLQKKQEQQEEQEEKERSTKSIGAGEPKKEASTLQEEIERMVAGPGVSPTDAQNAKKLRNSTSSPFVSDKMKEQ